MDYEHHYTDMTVTMKPKGEMVMKDMNRVDVFIEAVDVRFFFEADSTEDDGQPEVRFNGYAIKKDGTRYADRRRSSATWMGNDYDEYAAHEKDAIAAARKQAGV